MRYLASPFYRLFFRMLILLLLAFSSVTAQSSAEHADRMCRCTVHSTQLACPSRHATLHRTFSVCRSPTAGRK